METPAVPETRDDSPLAEMAREIFGISMTAWQMRQRSKATGGIDLSEAEYLTLDLLDRDGTMNVGQLQRQIGVLPAQMSRIIRALESKFDKPLIECSINPDDKRKVDVSLTDAGKKAHDKFRDARLGQSMAVLSQLDEKDIEDFMRVMRRIREAMAPPPDDQ